MRAHPTGPGIPDDRRVVVVRRLRDPGLARLLESYLREQGISCVVHDRIVLEGGLFRLHPFPEPVHELLVFEEDAEEARRLITEFLEATPP
jgi:hypothetical protein